MTDLSELISRLQRANEYEPLGNDGWAAADAILSLIKRVDELERLDKVLDKCEAAEKLLDAAEAHARGVAEGLERAAKVAEGVDPVSGERGQAWVAHSLYDNMRKHVAAAIRRGE